MPCLLNWETEFDFHFDQMNTNSYGFATPDSLALDYNSSRGFWNIGKTNITKVEPFFISDTPSNIIYL